MGAASGQGKCLSPESPLHPSMHRTIHRSTNFPQTRSKYTLISALFPVQTRQWGHINIPARRLHLGWRGPSGGQCGRSPAPAAPPPRVRSPAGGKARLCGVPMLVGGRWWGWMGPLGPIGLLFQAQGVLKKAGARAEFSFGQDDYVCVPGPSSYSWDPYAHPRHGGA